MWSDESGQLLLREGWWSDTAIVRGCILGIHWIAKTRTNKEKRDSSERRRKGKSVASGVA